MRTINVSADDIRVMLHLLGVTIWLGGQILMLGLLPVLRGLGGNAPQKAAGAFGRVAWPAFALIIITGMWNVFAVDMANVSTGWSMVFGFKFLLVIVTGIAAWLHQRTDSPAIRGATGGIGFIAALAAFALGVLMSH